MLKWGVFACLAASFATPCFAQVVAPSPGAFAQKLRETRIGIVTGGPGGVYIQLGADLQNLVEKATEGGLRVLPIVGRGSVGNLQDLLYLEYTDFALVQADVLLSIQQGDQKEFDFLKRRISYVTRLHSEIVHVLARDGLRDVEDLRGKTIAVGGAGGGSAITAPIVLRDLLGVEFEVSNLNPGAALNDMVSDDPEVDALVYVAGRGSPIFREFSDEMKARLVEKGVGFVSLPPPPSEGAPYQPVGIGHEDYPLLVGEEEGEVSGWAVPAVLAVYNWYSESNTRTRQRYGRVETFINAFFSARHELNDGPGGYNANWCDVDVGASIEGWTRLRAAQEWLNRNPRAVTQICAVKPGGPSVILAADCRPFHEHIAQVGLRLEDLVDPYAQFERWLVANPKGCAPP
ncbi:TAXI family TRAP transporter solute-binding subunit [Neomegalonema perideroedes]|uniref:TAXI family TRAP transporter solute-binding subunit n=1 Tax=Neomegalonema perideroedes TaxID=217219 RepID=UPI000365B03C|nr:TAXI family TRAP transporter solute-binding subunit [Neomegalonema perideroedes]